MDNKEFDPIIINEENYVGQEFNVFSVENTSNNNVAGYKRDDNLSKKLDDSLSTNTERKVADVANETVGTASGGTAATSTTAGEAISTAVTGAGTAATSVVVAASGAGIGIVAIGLSFAAFNARINNFQYKIDNENAILKYDFEIGYNVKGLVYVSLTDNEGQEVTHEYEVLEEKEEELEVEGYTYASYISGSFFNNEENTQINYNTEYQLSVYVFVNKQKRVYYKSEEPIVFTKSEDPILDAPCLVGDVTIKKDPNRLAASTNAVIYVEPKEEEYPYLEIKLVEKGLEEPIYISYFSFYGQEEQEEGTNPGIPYQNGYKYNLAFGFGGLTIGQEYEIIYNYFYSVRDEESPQSGDEVVEIEMFRGDLLISQEEVTDLKPYVELNYYYVDYYNDEDALCVSYDYKDNGITFSNYAINIYDMNNQLVLEYPLEEFIDQQTIRIPLDGLTKGTTYIVEVIGVNDTVNNTLIKHAIYY